MKKPSKKTLDEMYRAIAKYIQEAGGSAAVLGGVSIMKFPDDLKYNYTLAVRITGSLRK